MASSPLRAVLSAARPASRDEWLALLVPFGVYLALSSLLGAWIIDDAGITFAYARNVAHGYGFVSQPGRPAVEGFSDFLWMLLFVPLFALHLFTPVLVPKALGALFVLGSFRAVQRALQDDNATGRVQPGFFVAMLFAASPPLAIWCASGLENSLYLFLVSLLYAVAVVRPARFRLWLGVVTGLAAMTRPEGITLAVAGAAIAVGEWFARRATWREALFMKLEYLRGLAYVVVPFLALRVAVFDRFLPHTYYAKRTFETASERLDYFSDHPEAVTDKLMELGHGLAGKAGPWLLAAIVLSVFMLARRGKLRADVGAAAAILVVSTLTFVWMDEDWMGELRFGTVVIASAWLTAVAAGYAALRDLTGNVARHALTTVYALACAGLLALSVPRVAKFAAFPPTSYADTDRQYALKLNAYADALGVSNGSVLAPDCGAMLMDSHLSVLDEAGLFEPDVVRTLKHDGTHWLFTHPDFFDWTFDTAKPTFIVTHDFWSYVTAFEKDPRFARDYAPIDAYPDRYVDAVYKTKLHSGIYVRRDALHAADEESHIDRARASYLAPPRPEPFVTRLRAAFGMDPIGPKVADKDLRAMAMAARYEDQNPNRAATLFARLVERKPDDLEAQNELGDALDAAGRADEARPAWERVLALAEANHDKFHVSLADDRLHPAALQPPVPSSEPEQARLMQAGLDALYGAAHDAPKAVDLFRQVLALNPRHYGASYQLAAALDAAGRKDEARPLWQVVQRMADRLGDQKTAADATARIASGG